MLKVQEIRELIKLIDESSITEFKYETDNAEVHLKKGTGEAPAAPTAQPSVVQPTEPISSSHQHLRNLKRQANQKKQLKTSRKTRRGSRYSYRL